MRALALLAALLAAPAVAESPAPKTLRYAFRVAETGFDPAKINDLYSRTITPHIFEALVTYDHLARPVKLKPLTAVELPTANADFTQWTARIRPGIYFQDDPAFNGKPRELTAADYAFSIKRFADPKVASPVWTTVESWQLSGLKAARDAALKAKRDFDYDAPIAGLQVLDRHTLRFQLERPNPRFLQEIALSDLFGAVAREVIEAAGDQTMARPVGTGPFKLVQWRRGSLIALEKNPGYRERYYEAEPAADDTEGQAMLAKFKGRRIPMIDRVEVSILAEDQPRWLSFIGGEHDFIERLPEPFVSVAAPNGKLAPNLAKQGMRLHRTLGSDILLLFFNMEDAVVGGLEAHRVALRRAIGLGMDIEREIRLVRRGQAIPAQSNFPPHTLGYDPGFKSESSDFDPPRAKALLDVYGYRDRDGDGCREAPDGSKLELLMNTHPEGVQRALDELFDKDMRRIGLCIPFKTAKWPEQLKAMRAGKFQMWTVAYSSAQPDVFSATNRLSSKFIGGNNPSRFSLPEADQLVDEIGVMPDGPERMAKVDRLRRIAAAFAPYKFKGHRFHLDIERVQLSGYRRPLFNQNWWEYVDIDLEKGATLSLNRRQALVAAGATPALAVATGKERRKVFRMAFQVAETGFDPARISDIYSRIITGHIFEALYGYDPLARPARIVPRVAVDFPEVNEDFTQFTIRIRPGILFQDDPVFKGRPRELTAEDFVYSLKRYADPKLVSPMWPEVEAMGLLGLAPLRERAKQSGSFDYDQPIEGLRAIDRHQLQLRLAAPRPRLVQVLAQSDHFGAVAREVVEHYGDDIAAHPVGTGPYRLVQWRRSSFIALERHAGFRELRWDTAATDAEAQAIAARLRGRRLPLIDRIEVSPIEESQPRWLSFLNGEHDFIERLPPDFTHVALPHGKIAPNLAKRGIQLYRLAAADCAYTFFNMEDPVVGGLAPHQVALRRAISLGIDVGTEIQRVRRGQAVPAQSMVLPHSSGYDPAYRSENSEFSPARAKALLDLHGYLDRDGDGFRELPDGKPFSLEIPTTPDALQRQYDEQWLKNMTRIGIRLRFASRKWPEQLKLARAGKLQMWTLGQTGQYPDGILMLQRLYGPAAGQQNLARFRLPAFDRLFEQVQRLPDGAEREALFREAKRIQAAYLPMKVHAHRVINDMAQPWVIGYRRQLFWVDFWQFIDIDLDRKAA